MATTQQGLCATCHLSGLQRAEASTVVVVMPFGEKVYRVTWRVIDAVDITGELARSGNELCASVLDSTLGRSARRRGTKP